MSRYEPFSALNQAFFGPAVFVLVFILGFSGCAPQQTQYEVLASRFTVAAEKLETQRFKTLQALQEASEAQIVAVAQEQFDFRSAETLAFVNQWESAGIEVSQLRSDVATAVSRCHEMLDGLKARAENIKDPEIRDRTVNYVDQRREEFNVAARQTDDAITSMENAMSLGNDIIESLRIVGTANLVRQKIGELETRQKEAIGRFPDVDTIIEEGRKFLNIEFGEEIFL